MILPVGDVHNRPGSSRTATWAILIANVLVYLYELQIESAGGYKALQKFFFQYAMVPKVILLPSGTNVARGILPDSNTHVIIHVNHPHMLGLFTALFIHANFLHIAGNMLFFWIFADNVEDILGTPMFVLLYFACGIMANIAQIAIQPGSIVPVFGASGAIAGVLGAYLLLFPWNKVKLFYWLFFFWFGIWEVSALYVLGFWFLWQLLAQMISGGMSGVAYMAHVGGFMCGLALAAVLPKREFVQAYYRSIRWE